MRAPSKTVTTGSVSGAVVVLILWAWAVVFPSIDIPADVAAAVAVLVTAGAAWIVPDPARRPGRH